MNFASVMLALERLFDLCFDTCAALWRLTLRGRLVADVVTARSNLVGKLSSEDVFAQRIAINAADHEQALAIIRLDPRQYLPTELDSVLLDVIGPLESPGNAEQRPYLVGIVQKATIAELRRRKGPGNSVTTECFSYTPLEAADYAFFFFDDHGKRRRRLRRSVTLFCVLLTAVATTALWSTWRNALDSAVARSESQQLTEERSVRRAAHAISRLNATAPSFDDATSIALVELNTALDRLGTSLTSDSELSHVDATPEAVTFSGVTYDPISLELSLRRSFEGVPVAFTSQGPSADTAMPFEGQVRVHRALSERAR